MQVFKNPMKYTFSEEYYPVPNSLRSIFDIKCVKKGHLGHSIPVPLTLSRQRLPGLIFFRCTYQLPKPWYCGPYKTLFLNIWAC